MGSLIPPVVPAGTLTDVAQPEIAVDDELLLRPWQTADVQVVIEAFSVPDIQYWHFSRIDTEDEAAAWIALCAEGWNSEKSATWAIVDRPRERVVGRVCVHTILEDGLGEVSYWVVPEARRKGVATRACIAATRWAHELGLHRIQLEHSTKNEASRRVALRAGFIDEGVRRGASLHADGWHDMRVYSLLAGEGNGGGVSTK